MCACGSPGCVLPAAHHTHTKGLPVGVSCPHGRRSFCLRGVGCRRWRGVQQPSLEGTTRCAGGGALDTGVSLHQTPHTALEIRREGGGASGTVDEEGLVGGRGGETVWNSEMGQGLLSLWEALEAVPGEGLTE